MKIYLASGNEHKKKEFESLLPKFDIVIPKEEGIEFNPQETGASFFENALIKAQDLYKIVQKPVISDDSGLCIDFLNGAPGIFSARYGEKDGRALSFEEKIEKVLHEMKGAKNRRAYFVCCIVVLFNEHRFFSVQEICEGSITEEACGKNGFGYDPIFYIKEFGKTFAELTDDEKNTVSHRGKAVRAVAKQLENTRL